jgi:hypothetical protein
MIAQDLMGPGQGFLDMLRTFRLSYTLHLLFFLIYAGGSLYAIQDIIRHRHEAGLVYCMLLYPWFCYDL